MTPFLYPKEISLLDGLHQSATRFLVIGGHAVISHGYFRPAKNLDLWLFPGKENVARLAKAFARSGTPIPTKLVARLAYQEVHVPIPGWNIEILTNVEGLEFEGAFSRAVIMYVQGVQYPVLNLADLIRHKTALGREADLEDVRQLYALQTPPDERATAISLAPE